MNQSETSQEFGQSVHKLLGDRLISATRIGAGGNSRVYRIDCEGSSRYALKLYFPDRSGKRDRLFAEFSSLQFLWENGVRCIPRPVAHDRDLGHGIYEYIEGRPVSSSEVDSSDIDQAAQFLSGLHELGQSANSDRLGTASEACFSAREIFHTIDQRLLGLSALKAESTQERALRTFLQVEFLPFLGELRSWCEARLIASDRSLESKLEPQKRTLSPSDFGFHNALKRSDGQIVFLDFEHFGWDDPAKMVSDFLLHPHPAMALSDSLKRQFVNRILDSFGDREDLAARLEIAYPLFGLKWCMILLNEFVPEGLKRRLFSREDDLDKGVLQEEQLGKARRMLLGVRNSYRRFPHAGGS